MDFIWTWLKGYLLARLDERSTWSGLIGGALVKLAVTASPEANTALVNLGLSFAVALIALTKDGAVRRIEPAAPAAANSNRTEKSR